MKRTIVALAILGWPLLVSAAAADDKQITEIVTGAWQVVSLESGGEKQDVPEGDEAVVTFKEGKAIVKGEEQFSFTIDAATDPKIIDFVKITDPEKGQLLEGIYKVDGDTLTICLWSGMGAKSRPAEFATKVGDNYVLIALKRM